MTDAAQGQAADPLRDDAFLAAYLDTVIPTGDGMPGAGSLGLAVGLRKQVGGNPMFAGPVTAALAALRDAALARDPGGLPALRPDAREELLTALLPQQPVLGMLQLLVFTQYYQHPAALEALGQPARPPFPGGHVIQPTDPALLEKLRERSRS